MSQVLPYGFMYANRYSQVPGSDGGVNVGGHLGKKSKNDGFFGSSWKMTKGFWQFLAWHGANYDPNYDKYIQYEDRRIAEDLTMGFFILSSWFTLLSMFITMFIWFYVSTRLDIDLLSRSIIIGAPIFLMHICRVRLVMGFEEGICNWMYAVVYTPTWTKKIKRFFLIGLQQIVLYGFGLAASVGAYQAVNSFAKGDIGMPVQSTNWIEGILMLGGLSMLGTFLHFTVQFRIGMDRCAYVRMAETDVELSHLDAAVIALYKTFSYLLLYGLVGVPLDSTYILTCLIFNTGTGNTAANYVGAIFIGQVIFAAVNWLYNLIGKPVVIGRRMHLDKDPDPLYSDAI